MGDPGDCTGLRVTRSLFPALGQLTELGFQFDLSQAHQDPSFKYDNGYILQRGDRAVASGWINNVSCQGDGVDLAVAAVGIVTTHPAERGQGYGLRLMAELLAGAQQEGYDLSLVFPWREDWYARVGYTAIHSPYRRLDLANLRQMAHRFPHQVRGFRADQDGAAVAAIHRGFSGQYVGPLKRDDDSWPWGLDQKGTVLVAEVQGEVVAYLVGRPLNANHGTGPYGLKVREFGCRPGQEAGLDALLCALVPWLEAGEFGAIYQEDLYRSSLPAVASPPPYQDLARPSGEHYRAADQAMVQMYRLLNLRSLLRKLTPVWNRRLNRPGQCWQDIFTLENTTGAPQGPYTVRFVASRAEISLGQAEFLALFVLAATDWSSLRPTALPDCTDAEMAAMQRLFPQRRFIYWDTDSF